MLWIRLKNNQVCMKQYLIPLTALAIGVGMMGGGELGTRRKEIPPRSVRMLRQADLDYTNQIVFDPPGSVVFTLKCVGTNAQDYVDAAKYFKVMPDLVNLLAITREICAVHGHAWKAMPHMTLEVQYGPVEARQCVVCGKYESRSMPAWPTP